MTLIHIVLFSFKPEVTQEHKDNFVRAVKNLKTLPSVKEGRLLVGGSSITKPIELSKGFEFALVSYHENYGALEEYEASEEHDQYEQIRCCVSAVSSAQADSPRSVTTTYMFPFDKDFSRFDFEVEPEDEYMCAFGLLPILAGKTPGNGSAIN
ncbi:hypothetical protein N7454_009689 [Penicillium verhagenii]|nr:hypothetical protein N7454_009689 [Penicillium verhagenii]